MPEITSEDLVLRSVELSIGETARKLIISERGRIRSKRSINM